MLLQGQGTAWFCLPDLSLARLAPGSLAEPGAGRVLLSGSLTAAVSLAGALANPGLTAGPARLARPPAGYLNPILICLMSSGVWCYCRDWKCKDWKEQGAPPSQNDAALISPRITTTHEQIWHPLTSSPSGSMYSPDPHSILHLP